MLASLRTFACLCVYAACACSRALSFLSSFRVVTCLYACAVACVCMRRHVCVCALVCSRSAHIVVGAYFGLFAVCRLMLFAITSHSPQAGGQAERRGGVVPLGFLLCGSCVFCFFLLLRLSLFGLVLFLIFFFFFRSVAVSSRFMPGLLSYSPDTLA